MPRLTVLMGAPGSGKSTYAKRLGNVVSNDRSTRQDPGSILHQSYKQIHQMLAQGKDVVFDCTAANPNVRKAALSIARQYGAETAIRVLDTPLDTCLKNRTSRVSDADVRRIHADVRRQMSGLKNEGFQSVQVTRDRK
jgi:predicted kinase